MDFTIDTLSPGDAGELLSYLRTVGGESGNLSFGEEGLPCAEEDERRYIESALASGREILLIAESGGRLIGECTVRALSRRFAHRAELGISVLREFWRCGVGAALMAEAIGRSREMGLEILSLEVRSDNLGAIKLYEKFGFERIGTFKDFFKIGNDYFDAELMELHLRRT